MNETPIKVGISGLGRSGWGLHVAALGRVQGLFEITAVFDPDPVRQQEARAQLGCRAYGSYAELLADSDIELMVVASPSPHHADDTIAALEAGKHVLVEKPMATTLADIDRMIEAAEKNGRLLTVNQNYRYAADFLKIKEVVASGVLGDLLLIRLAQHQFRRRWDWQTLTEFGGGILNNHGAHYVDWALSLIDDPEPEVLAHLVDTPLYAGDADSHAKVILRPKTGPLVDIELTHACAFPQQTAVIMGTQGTLSSTREEVRWKYYKPDEVPPLVLDRQPTPDRSYNAENLPMWEESYRPVLDMRGEIAQLYRDLYQTIRHAAPLAITPQSVRRLMAVLAACRKYGAD